MLQMNLWTTVVMGMSMSQFQGLHNELQREHPDPSISVPSTTIINKHQRQQESHMPMPLLKTISGPSPSETNGIGENSSHLSSTVH